LAINYKTQDFVAAIKNFTGDFGVNVVLDMVGGAYIPRNLEVLAMDGRHVSIAFQQGMKAEIDLRSVMQKRLVLTGSTLRNRSVVEKSALAQDVRRNVWELVESGAVRPVVFKIFPLEHAAAAHQALENGDHVGKIVLRVT
jgi:NADPH:quinone reductase-like Zn-dependent oxidoreductase